MFRGLAMTRLAVVAVDLLLLDLLAAALFAAALVAGAFFVAASTARAKHGDTPSATNSRIAAPDASLAIVVSLVSLESLIDLGLSSVFRWHHAR